MKPKKQTPKTEASLNLPQPLLAFLPFAFLAWACYAAYNYLQQYPINISYVVSMFFDQQEAGIANLFHLFVYLPSILGIILYALSVYGLGSALVKLIGLSFDQDEKAIFSTALGFVALIYFLLLTGTAGLLYPVTVLIILLIGLFIGVKDILANRPNLEVAAAFKKQGVIMKLLLLVAASILAVVFIGVLTPETFYDTLNYHLGVPQQWINMRRVFPIENFINSYFTGNMHILYIPGLMFGTDLATKLTHFMFGILTTYTVYSWSRKHFSRETGNVAILIFLSIPFVGLVMWKTAIELNLAFFETMAVLSFLNFAGCEETRKRQWLLMSAVFAGTAFGGKYLSVFSIISVLAALAGYILVYSDRSKKTLLSILLFCVVSSVMMSPYLIRNLILKDNPLYPFSFSFGQDAKQTHSHRNQVQEIVDPPVPDRSISNFITLPWNIAMGKKTQEPFSGVLLLICIPLPFIFRKSDKRIRLLGFYCLAYYLCWFYLRTYFRYLVPSLPAFSLLFAYYLTNAQFNKTIRNVTLALFALLALSTLTFNAMSLKSSMDPVRVVLGIEKKADYLSTQRPTYPSPYYGVIDWANKNIPKDSKVVFLGECRTFYAKMKTVTYSTSDFCPLILWIKDSNNADEAAQALRGNGVTHILLNVNEARRLANYDMLHFEPRELAVFAQFWSKYVKEIYSDISDIALPQQGIFSLKKQQPEWWRNYSADELNYAKLYEIMPDAEAVKPHKPPRNFFLEPQLYSQKRWQILTAALANPGRK